MSTEDIVLLKFYLLDIQPLCHLKDVEKDKYLPCEMALLEYSLAKGIHQSVHHFIDPGNTNLSITTEPLYCWDTIGTCQSVL